jgi:hypothetical protein
VLYSNNFTSEAALTAISSNDPQLFPLAIADGELRIQRPAIGVDRVAAAIPRGSYTDTVIVVDARMTGELPERFYSIACRSTADASNQYRFEVDPNQTRFRLTRILMGSDSPFMGGWVSSPAIKSGREVNQLELRCVGSTLAASVNGTQVASVDDQLLTNGVIRIGVGTPSTVLNAAAEARFDNLVVFAPE